MKSASESSETNHVTPSISYKLSQEQFKTLGWTSLPEKSSVVPYITMKAKFSHDVISPWFASGKRTKRFYRTGKTLCATRENGTGCIYYPNGRLAIEVIKSGQETRIIVKSPGGIDRDGKKRQPHLCGLFDSLGNGVVYDHDRKKRLVYNQRYGVAFMKADGKPVTWKWHGFRFTEHISSSNWKRSRRIVGSIFARTDSINSKNMSSEEFREMDEGNYVDTSRIQGTSPIKPIIFQINSYIGLRIFNQAEIALTFFAEGQQTRLNIGTLYNPCDMLSVDNIFAGSETEKIYCPLEVQPTKSTSMEVLRRLLKHRTSGASSWNFN